MYFLRVVIATLFISTTATLVYTGKVIHDLADALAPREPIDDDDK